MMKSTQETTLSIKFLRYKEQKSYLQEDSADSARSHNSKRIFSYTNPAGGAFIREGGTYRVSKKRRRFANPKNIYDWR